MSIHVTDPVTPEREPVHPHIPSLHLHIEIVVLTNLQEQVVLDSAGNLVSWRAVAK